jgi:hypothetical protein
VSLVSISSVCHSSSSSRLLTTLAVCDMEEPTQIYHSSSSRWRQRNLAQTAPVAAKFEDCHQYFTRLCVALKEHASPSDVDLAEDSFARFLAWGNDTGAMTRSLDHALRKASGHQKKTLELLTTLHSTLVEGMRLFLFENLSMAKTAGLTFMNLNSSRAVARCIRHFEQPY